MSKSPAAIGFIQQPPGKSSSAEDGSCDQGDQGGWSGFVMLTHGCRRLDCRRRSPC
jgi:hypothetical protein